MALISVVMDDLLDLRKWAEASSILEEKGEREAERALRAYTADDLIQRIRGEQNEPHLAEFVQHIAEGASSEEDRYLIAEAAYVIVEALKIQFAPDVPS